MAHKHSIYDTDPHFKIDPATRAIQNESGKVKLMQYDHKSERFTFEIPRFIDGHDTSLCNLVTIDFDNVDSSTKAKNSDIYEVKDLQLSPASEDVVIFSWLIEDSATQFKGELKFSISFQCISDNGVVEYDFGTDIHYGIMVGERLRNAASVVEKGSNILVQWKADLFGIGDTEEAKLLSTSQEQQSDISEAGQAQVDAVNARGAAVLETIPDDYEALSALADENARIKAGAIVLKAEGETIAVADSANAYLPGMRLYGKSEQKSTTGKNLLPYTTSAIERNGVTYTPVLDDDGALEYILANGTATDLSYFQVEKELSLPDGNYILSGCPNGGGTATYDLRFNGPDARDYGNGVEFAITSSIAQNNVTIVIRSGVTVTNLRFYPMIRLATIVDDTYEVYTGGKPSPSPEYPQEIDSAENAAVTVCGKNLLDVTKAELIVVGAGGSKRYGVIFDKPGTYTFSCNTISGIAVKVVTDGEYEKYVTLMDNVTHTFTLTENQYLILYQGSEGVLFNYNLKNAQIEQGDTATDYEPYKGQTFSLSRTLPGIPVTSGGNYTDLNGQQWICDEIDFERGAYIQRVGLVTIDDTYTLSVDAYPQGSDLWVFRYRGWSNPQLIPGSTVYHNSGYCNLFEYDDSPVFGNIKDLCAVVYDGLIAIRCDSFNGDVDAFHAWAKENRLTIQYVLATPIETPLSDAELLAFRALRSNKPVTTILNDSGMFMSVDYVADTKTYIDNKIAELIKNS